MNATGIKRLCCSTGPCSSHHVLTEGEIDAVTRRVEMRDEQKILNPNDKVSSGETFHSLNGENKSTRAKNGLSFVSAFY